MKNFISRIDLPILLCLVTMVSGFVGMTVAAAVDLSEWGYSSKIYYLLNGVLNIACAFTILYIGLRIMDTIYMRDKKE